jgi:hypothetical protein
MSNAHRIVLNTLGKLHAHRHGLFGFLSAPQLARSRNPAVAETVIRSARSVDASCSPSRRQDADKG